MAERATNEYKGYRLWVCPLCGRRRWFPTETRPLPCHHAVTPWSGEPHCERIPVPLTDEGEDAVLVFAGEAAMGCFGQEAREAIIRAGLTWVPGALLHQTVLRKGKKPKEPEPEPEAKVLTLARAAGKAIADFVRIMEEHNAT